jgi:D-amino-acid dehydrogenase
MPDVVVVGGGAVGVACAYELACAGARVTLVEREGALGLGCSYGNAGLIGAKLALPLATPQAFKDGIRWFLDPAGPFHVEARPSVVPWLLRFALACRPRRYRQASAQLLPLATLSWRLHLEYLRAGMNTGMRQNGALLTWESEAAFERDTGAHAGARLDGAEARRLEPSLSAAVVGALLDEEVAHTDSGLWTKGVGAAAADRGAEILLGTKVRRLVLQADNVTAVETDDGLLRAGAVVVAAGAWSASLVQPIGNRLPMEGGKGYHVDLEPAQQEPSRPVYMQDAHVVATPLGRCLRLAGTLELAGLDTSINATRTAAIVRAAERNLNGVGGRRVQELWAGLRPCAADGMPVIGRSPVADNLILATGHAMIGLVLAPGTGRVVAELAASLPQSLDLAPFRPDRF